MGSKINVISTDLLWVSGWEEERGKTQGKGRRESGGGGGGSKGRGGTVEGRVEVRGRRGGERNGEEEREGVESHVQCYWSIKVCFPHKKHLL